MLKWYEFNLLSIIQERQGIFGNRAKGSDRGRCRQRPDLPRNLKVFQHYTLYVLRDHLTYQNCFPDFAWILVKGVSVTIMFSAKFHLYLYNTSSLFHGPASIAKMMRVVSCCTLCKELSFLRKIRPPFYTNFTE